MKDETTTTKAPEGIKESRKEKRLKQAKQDILNNLVSNFFTERSSIKDPEGDEAAALFVQYQNIWIKECMNFNRFKNRPFTLRKRAFEDQINYFIEMEKKQKEKAEMDNKVKDFSHWLRKSNFYLKHPFRAAYYEIISGFNREKCLHLLKNYYIKHILYKTT
jgi:hypothetical protein